MAQATPFPWVPAMHQASRALPGTVEVPPNLITIAAGSITAHGRFRSGPSLTGNWSIETDELNGEGCCLIRAAETLTPTAPHLPGEQNAGSNVGCVFLCLLRSPLNLRLRRLLPDCPTRSHSAFGGITPQVYSGIGVQSALCGGERYLARNPARNLRQIPDGRRRQQTAGAGEEISGEEPRRGRD